jgi:D-arabinono-1,4-lactone oxidase
MPHATISPGADGLYHPSSEAEIIALVQYADAEGIQIRVRGAVHSMARAIYTDAGVGDPPVPNMVSVQAPPSGPHLNLMFDQYRRLTWVDASQGIVEVEAGLNLGWDPYDPSHTSTLENSLLYQAWMQGWTLRDLGGITHQTVSGFLSTGSSGGSLQYRLDENLLAFRLIDAHGQARWIARAQDPDLFEAVGVSMGLLGIISQVRLRLTPAFIIAGQEITTPTAMEECPIDLFGPGRDGKPSMQTFLEQTPYTRLLWWPQQGVDRVVIWQASPQTPSSPFDPVPYTAFGAHPELTELAGSFFYTLIGNLDDLSQVPRKLEPNFAQLQEAVDLVLARMDLGASVSEAIATVVARCTEGAADLVTWLLTPFAPLLRRELPTYLPHVIDLFQPLTGQDPPNTFQDYSWRSLPMDNAADDILLGTAFTELWIPLSQTTAVMQALKQHFDAGGLAATGSYATEIYAAPASDFWLSPAYKEPVIRVDIFWFSKNAGDPTVQGGFYDQFWQLLKPFGFRLHWGKGLPEYDYAAWAEFFHQHLPRLKDFLALRAEMDPQGLFLTDYWKRHLYGITAEP